MVQVLEQLFLSAAMNPSVQNAAVSLIGSLISKIPGMDTKSESEIIDLATKGVGAVFRNTSLAGSVGHESNSENPT